MDNGFLTPFWADVVRTATLALMTVGLPLLFATFRRLRHLRAVDDFITIARVYAELYTKEGAETRKKVCEAVSRMEREVSSSRIVPNEDESELRQAPSRCTGSAVLQS